MNYEEISKETISFLYKSYNSLKNSPLEAAIRVLVELRVSQINGCEYCCRVHAEEAKTLGIPEEKMDQLITWNIADVFSERERLALRWAEELTYLKIIQETKEHLKAQFSEREIVDITSCVSLMNSLNRLAISLKSF